MARQYTRSVYVSPDVEFCLRDGAYSVRAKADLGAGTLVLVEHAFAGTPRELHALLFLADALRRALHPRTDGDAAMDSEKNGEKISMNAFDFDGDTVIGDRICKFNHSCKPNAYLTWVDRVACAASPGVNFYGAWTVARVKSGDELTLDYTNGSADQEQHDANREKHGVVCSCTERAVRGASARAAIELDLATKFTREHKPFITALVNTYLDRWGPKMKAAHAEVREFARKNIRVE